MAAQTNNNINHTQLITLRQQIKAGVTDKSNPNADPDLVTATDLGGILDGLVDYQLKQTVPANPTDVLWLTRPGAPIINAQTITELASVIEVAGVQHNVAQATLSVPFAATDGRYRATTAIDTTLGTPVYKVILGPTVHYLAPLPAAVLPEGYLHVRDLIVTDGAIEPQPGPVVRYVYDSEGNSAFPDPDGGLLLNQSTGTGTGASFTTIPADYNGHGNPEFTSQHQFNLWLLDNAFTK